MPHDLAAALARTTAYDPGHPVPALFARRADADAEPPTRAFEVERHERTPAPGYFWLGESAAELNAEGCTDADDGR